MKQAGELFDVKIDTCDKKLESRKQKETMENAVNNTTGNTTANNKNKKDVVFKPK